MPNPTGNSRVTMSSDLTFDEVRMLPIRDLSLRQQEPVARLAKKIYAIESKDLAADTSALEREIDELVYAFYGLTPEEIRIVEGAAK